jgi:hypothetical protein
MKKLLFLGACLVALASSPVKAQTGAADVVVMTVKSVVLGRKRVVIGYSDGKTEEQIIKNVIVSDKGQDEGITQYQAIIAKLYQQGYPLKSTFSQDEGRSTSLIFVKGQ